MGLGQLTGAERPLRQRTQASFDFGGDRKDRWRGGSSVELPRALESFARKVSFPSRFCKMGGAEAEGRAALFSRKAQLFLQM